MKDGLTLVGMAGLVAAPASAEVSVQLRDDGNRPRRLCHAGHRHGHVYDPAVAKTAWLDKVEVALANIAPTRSISAVRW